MMTMLYRITRRAVLSAALGVTATVAIQTGNAAELELVEPGTLTVAFNGDMPGTGWENDRLIGLDGEIMQWVAEQLGLTVKPALMEWSAEIASVQARRVDAMHGMMGWTEPRTKVIAITDPIYYGGANIAQKKDQNWSTIEDLEGKRVATITGFGWIDEMKQIKDIDLRLYDTSDAAIRDLLAGRIDALFADPPLIQYAISKNPDWEVHAVPVSSPFDPKYPTLTGKYNIVFGLSQEAPNLLAAVNEKIAELWQSCKNLEIAKKYGLGDRSWFDPGSENTRAGVDRLADWQQPTLADSCK